MNRLIATVMLATIAAVVAEIADGDVATAVAWVSLALAVGRLRSLPPAPCQTPCSWHPPPLD